MSELIRAQRTRNFQPVPSHDDLAPTHPTRGKRILGLPRKLAITIGVILIIGVVFMAIIYPVLKSTVWKNGDGLSDSDNSGSGSGSGGSSNKPLNKWIDSDTPKELHTKKMEDGTEYQLVFSDEFNKDGRDFHPGKDKIWEGVDLHYWQTEDYEHYLPEQASTKDGKLLIKVEKRRVGDQDYVSAMLQTWNKFCFRGGYMEANVSLPGDPTVPALWPAVWTMGNLGRAGYSASTDGLWPYSYDTCDLGVTANQSNSGVVSWLPGQRLNKCLCSNQDTPSPGVGRGASELDLLEGAGGDNGVNGDEGNNGGGTISQSHQFAPFDIGYKANSQYVSIYNTSSTYKNSYDGGKLQQVISIKTKIDPQYYEGRAYQTYAFDYTPGPQGRVTWWVGDDKKWSFDAKAVDPNTQAKIGQRVISEEPMYLILNVAMSDTFGKIDFSRAKFPATMYVDYIRIYQHPDKVDIGCDPKDRPTAKYIKDHPKLYNDPSIHYFKDAGYPLPTYSLDGKCPA